MVIATATPDTRTPRRRTWVLLYLDIVQHYLAFQRVAYPLKRIASTSERTTCVQYLNVLEVNRSVNLVPMSVAIDSGTVLTSCHLLTLRHGCQEGNNKSL